jgi:uncharacterized protein
MGHRDSSAKVRGASAVRFPGGGIGAPAAWPERQGSAPIAARDTELSGGANATSRARPSGSLSASARALLMAVRIYQTFFSAAMPSACKFYPTCSHYAAEAIEVHGARRGAWLALRRLGRCHPFTRGGVDLVPDLPTDASAQDQHEFDSSVPSRIAHTDAASPEVHS